MGACSQCQSEVPEGATQCPNCGTPQIGAFDVPDLDFPAAPAPAPKTKPKTKSAPAKLELSLDTGAAPRSSEPPGGFQQAPGLDDEDELNSSGLELAVAPVRPVSVRPPAPSPEAAPPRGASSGRVSVPPPAGRRPSLPPPEPAGSPDLYEVRQLARFGPLPDYPWDAVVYAYRVFTRIRELKLELAQVREDRRRHEKAADEALLEFLDRTHDTLIQEASFARMFEPVREMQARFKERHAGIDELDQEGQRELAAIDGELLRCERVAQEGRSTKEGLSSEAARLYEASRGGDALASQLLDSIRAQMNKAEEEATQAVGLMNELRRRRRDIEQAFKTRIHEMEAALAESDSPRRAAMLEIGSGLLERKMSLPHEGFASVEVAKKRLQEAIHRQTLLEAALSAFDRKKVQEGVLYAAGALLLLIGAVVLGVLRMNQELSAPPPVLPPL